MSAAAFAMGRIGEFDDSQEVIDAYMERMEHWMAANNIEGPPPDQENAKDQRVSVLLTVIGAKTYGVLRNLLTRQDVHRAARHFENPLQATVTSHSGTLPFLSAGSAREGSHRGVHSGSEAISSPLQFWLFSSYRGRPTGSSGMWSPKRDNTKAFIIREGPDFSEGMHHRPSNGTRGERYSEVHGQYTPNGAYREPRGNAGEGTRPRPLQELAPYEYE